MKLDYIDEINEYGDNLVRLYDFNSAEANKFFLAIQQTLIVNKMPLDLSTLDFIEARNCSLVLRLSDEDNGIITTNNKKFFCELTFKGYEHMLTLLEPFCKKETKGYQWLYDVDSSTDFLFSPAGTW